MIVESGALQNCLACIGIYSHHIESPLTHRTGAKNDNNGVGFGSGATTIAWNAKKAMEKKVNEEKVVTALLQILASFINPQDEIPSESLELP